MTPLKLTKIRINLYTGRSFKVLREDGQGGEEYKYFMENSSYMHKNSQRKAGIQIRVALCQHEETLATLSGNSKLVAKKSNGITTNNVLLARSHDGGVGSLLANG